MHPTLRNIDSKSAPSHFKPEVPIAFESELKLVELFETMLGHKLTPQTKMLRELVGADGIADIVLFDLYKNHQKNLRLGDVHPRWAYALRELPYRKKFTLDDFINITGASKQRVKSELTNFVNLGYCTKSSNSKTWTKVSQPSPITKNIVAVEAKLKDWRRAVKQASRYKDYANQSWVLLDEASVRNALNHLFIFKEMNIGLASINHHGSVSLYHSPQALQPKSEIRFWQANSIIASRIRLGQ